MVEKQFDATRYRAAVDLFYIHMGVKMVVQRVFIVGAGLMGGGIAQVCAQAGLQVTITDVSSEAVDKGLRLASGRKMGPFETGDMVGLDVTCGALMAIYEETKDPSWYPPSILRRKVKAGHLGRKTGRGWYEYNADGSRKDK